MIQFDDKLFSPQIGRGNELKPLSVQEAAHLKWKLKADN